MAQSDDKAILVGALEAAMAAYNKLYPHPTILGSPPDSSVLEPLATEISKCAAYLAVAGHGIFNGTSSPVLHANRLAPRIFSSVRYGTEGSESAKRLLRVLQTRHADGMLKTAIWGISVDREISLTPSCRLIPFDQLPKSYSKDRIIERARTYYDGSSWITQNYFDKPQAALIEEAPQFPYIGSAGAILGELAKLERKAHELSVTLQAAAVGKPLAIACWFEFNDPDLHYLDWDNNLTWLLPEIPSRVSQNFEINPDSIRAIVVAYNAISSDRRTRVLRSMERFRLSQSRREAIDRVLDLALAFEIAVSEDNDGSPPSWKVSVRTAQLIGGPFSDRQAVRDTIADLYGLRNRATHGSSLQPKKGGKPVDDTIRESFAVFVKLTAKLLALQAKPDWKAIELGALPTDNDYPPTETKRT